MGQVVTPAFYAINVSLRLFTTPDFLFFLSLLDTTMNLRVRVHNMGLISESFYHIVVDSSVSLLKTIIADARLSDITCYIVRNYLKIQ